uniref:Fork-head domain-containing protein n=1 Tax=Gouania willdenowi TaxID=441366 RepID=A0A8C5GG79_GOUWI
PQQPIPQVEVDYKTNPNVKPPYTYKSLICMTMQASKQPKVTLSTICKWITENFCYYRHADPSWQKAIRWNLSTKKCFRKVPRQKDEPGKGGFWQIDPEYSDRLLKGCYKPRKNKRFEGYQGTASTSGNQGVSPEQMLLSSTDDTKTTRSTETPLVARKPDSLSGDNLAAAYNYVFAENYSILEDFDYNAALRSLERLPLPSPPTPHTPA